MKLIDQIKSMNRERLIIWVMCFLFVIIGFCLLLGMKDAKQCLGNPFIYGASNIVNDRTGDVYCSCSFTSPNYAGFYFDKDSLEIGEG